MVCKGPKNPVQQMAHDTACQSWFRLPNCVINEKEQDHELHGGGGGRSKENGHEEKHKEDQETISEEKKNEQTSMRRRIMSRGKRRISMRNED